MHTSVSRISSGLRRRGCGPSMRRFACATLLVLVSIAGCTKSGDLDPGALGRDTASMRCFEPKSNDKKDVVCSRWACGHSDLVAARWDGDALRCAPGTIEERARKSALRLVNAYRFLAGVPEIDPEPRWDGPAQECALLAHANNKLSHAPPRDSACWSYYGARASAVSLVANRSAPLAIDPFIEDPGNEDSMVHRRWLLSEKIHRLGLGSTSRFACALVDGREWDPPPAPSGEDAGAEPAPSAPPDPPDAGGPTWPFIPSDVGLGGEPDLPPLPDLDAPRDAGAQEDPGPASDPETPSDPGTSSDPDAPKAEEPASEEDVPEWVAWPPPGPVPFDAIERTRVDLVGWTIQSSSLDLDGAHVEVKVGGVRRAIKTHSLERTMGSLTAIRFVPRGWATKPDERYDVHVVKDETVIDYTVEPLRCP